MDICKSDADFVLKYTNVYGNDFHLITKFHYYVLIYTFIFLPVVNSIIISTFSLQSI